jgi:hypothetical protein
MPANSQLTLTYQARPLAGADENWWIRLEQVGVVDEFASLGEAAGLIDKLFGVEPCDAEAWGQGEPAAEEETTPEAEPGTPTLEPAVSEEEFSQAVVEALATDACAGPDLSWQAEVKVVRSHLGEPYALVIDGGQVVRRVAVQQEVSETLSFSGDSSQDLPWPVQGRPAIGWRGRVLTESGQAPTVSLRGSTVNLSEPATGLLVLRYLSQYDLVTVRVAAPLDGDERTSAESAALYHRLVATCTLEPPEIAAADQDEPLLCAASYDVSSDPDNETRCVEILRKYTRCACSGDVAESFPELEMDVPCPEGTGPGVHYLGSRSQLVAYVNCGETDGDMDDPDFYKQNCCVEGQGPPCRVRRGILAAGAPCKHREMYASIYAPLVRFVAVSPKSGNCGTIEWRQQLNARDCCEAGIPVHLPNDTVVPPESLFSLTALDGVPPFVWDLGDMTLVAEGPLARTVYLRSPEDFCGWSEVKVTDACNTEATCTIRSTLGRWVPRTVEDPCSRPPGFAPGPSDTDGPSDLCGSSFSLPSTRTSGPWMVNVAYAVAGFYGSCPELDCSTLLITSIGSLGDPNRALCLRYQCLGGRRTTYSGGCCTMLQDPNPQYAMYGQRVSRLYEWVCE